MFCKNCGTKVDPGAKFCNSCGTPIDDPTESASGARQTASGGAQNQGKKKLPLWLIAVIGVAAFLIGKSVIAPSMLSGHQEPEETGSRFVIETPGTVSINEDYDSSVSVSNSAFDEIFSSNYIVRADALFLGLDSAAFALESEGMIDCMEFGYQDDMICEMVETIYLDISAMSDEERSATDSQMRDAFSSWEACGFCEVSYDLGNSWYIVSIKLHDLDQSDVVKTAAENGMLTLSDDAEWLSISATEESLLDQGYVKK